LRISSRDAFWLVPFAAGTGVALHYDGQAQQNLGIDQSRIDTSNTISQFGSTYATLAGANAWHTLLRKKRFRLVAEHSAMLRIDDSVSHLCSLSCRVVPAASKR
jgi:hypothetical protein